MKHFSSIGKPLAIFSVLWFQFAVESSQLYAQDSDLGVESVTVVKNYAPVVLVGPKPILAPLLSDYVLPKKMVLQYQIINFPVASTFLPALGDPKKLLMEKAAPDYNSMLQFGLGMRATADLLYETRYKISRYERYYWGATHQSMAADLPNIPWDSNFFDSELFGGYAYDKRETHLSVGLKLNHLANSWYGLGLEDAYANTPVAAQGKTPNLSALSLVYPNTAENLDIQQGYFGGQIHAQYSKDKGVFKQLNMNLHYFRDRTASQEQQAQLNSHWEFPLGNVPLAVYAGAVYVGGGFKTNSLSSFESFTPEKYGFFKGFIAPNVQWSQGAGFFKLGAKIMYTNVVNETASPVRAYPDIYAHYGLVDKKIMLYGRLEGDYELQSFEGFVNENPFVSPSLTILPTDRRYWLQMGVKGALGSFSYEAYWKQQSIASAPLFVANPSNYFRTFERGFNAGNSFAVVYDAIDQSSFGASLSLEAFGVLKLRGQYETNRYSMTVEEEAWHLPEETAYMGAALDLSERFKLDLSWNYVGKRAVRESQLVSFVMPGPLPSFVYDLPAYGRLDLRMDYRLNDRLDLFLKGTNLGGSVYEMWSGFNAPPRMVLLGARYGFEL